jgi:uncharacterized cofD-like protein
MTRLSGRRVVAVGGGTGLATLLSGLKSEVGAAPGAPGASGTISDLAAVVAVTDDGGSSGRLRREMGVPPPGDIRNCLVALAGDQDLLARLFQFRFAGPNGLSGHSFGNLFLAALTEITGDFAQAIATAEHVLSVRGRILPAATVDLHLKAVGRSGATYDGESAIGASPERLARLELVPEAPAAFPLAAEAIAAADLVLLGPGSLYTSILPNLLIPGIRAAIAATHAPVVLLLNLMTQPGETRGLTALEHLDVLEQHLGRGIVDAVVAHEGAIPESRLSAYREQGAEPVGLDEATRVAFEARGLRVVAGDLLAEGPLVRHDPARLAAAALKAAS